jgi:phage/plasmid-like protein (TIGR03299 family)
MTEALEAGRLNWEVGEVDLQTKDTPPSPVRKRKAIVRKDRHHGEQRVLGVVHRGFKPIQNQDGAQLFDAIFGKGKAVYHTGGYLGNGEVVWLMAKLDTELIIASGDVVTPYALCVNSHDGSKAFSISLTTIRVVCQNTLNMAIQQKSLAKQFRRAHQGTLREHAQAALAFWDATNRELELVKAAFNRLATTPCNREQSDHVLNQLLPMPAEPRSAANSLAAQKAHENRLAGVEAARKTIAELRTSGKGADLASSRGTMWGMLNAVTEYVDHHREIKGDRVSYVLLGDGRDMKVKAYRIIQVLCGPAA